MSNPILKISEISEIYTKDGNYPKYLHRQITNGIKEFHNYAEKYKELEIQSNRELYENLKEFAIGGWLKLKTDPQPMINGRYTNYDFHIEAEVSDSFKEKYPKGTDPEKDWMYSLVDYVNARNDFEYALNSKLKTLDELNNNIDKIFSLDSCTDKERRELESSIYNTMNTIDIPFYYEKMDNLIELRPQAFPETFEINGAVRETGKRESNKEYTIALQDTKKPFKKIMNNLKKTVHKYDLMQGYHKTDFDSLDVDGRRKRE